MIQTENLTINDREFKRTYSDEDFYILQEQTGIEYTEAIDVMTANYTYIETDKPIEKEEEEKTDIEQKAEAWDILTGGKNNE